MKGLVERLKWRIAELLNRLPNQCWTGNASWVLGDQRWPWRRIDAACREDAERVGFCYCGKLPRKGDAS